MKVVFWGTYDKGKPRTRILLQGFEDNGIEVIECYSDVWKGVDDKSQIFGKFTKIKFLFKWFIRYPKLIIEYLRLPEHEAVIICYLGHLDVLLLWPFVKMRGVPMVWDAFLSLYNTVIEDRRLLGKWNPLSFLLYAWEWLACRAADLILLDTRAHADYFAELYHVPRKKIESVFVGVEGGDFYPQELGKEKNENFKVLFYGQFIPLHGIETIIRAAQKLNDHPIKFTLIGKGQVDSKIKKMLSKEPLENLEWIPWVPYEELVYWINNSDVCLGIFGDSRKASMVIPNKVFQIIACGKPFITRDSPAIRELVSPEMPGVTLVPPGDQEALANAIESFQGMTDKVFHRDVRPLTLPSEIGKKLIGLLVNNLEK